MDKIPDSLLGFALGNLKELVMYNYNLIRGAEGNVNELCDDLDTLKGFIEECMETNNNSKSNPNRFLQVLIDKVRKVVYQAEDIIERFIVSASLQNDRDFVDKTLHAIDYASCLRGVAKQIEVISKDVQKFYEKQAPLGIAAMQVNAIRNRDQKKKKADLVVEEDDVVGFDDEVREVINLLTGESERLEVISVIGMPGLGKTTLAKRVISDPIIKHRFPTHAFVNVSQEYERREVFLNILGALPPIPEGVNYMSDQQLVEVLRERLKTKKYLFVMDDVGAPEAWNDLKCAFPNNRGSMVLITSRDDRVAYCANPRCNPYRLRLLTTEESRELLRRRVFGENSCPEKLVKYELQIAKKCEGLPLKVVLIAGILQDDRERTDWWEEVAEGKYAYVKSDVIRMCYENLPYYLRPCFLYLGVFHEDVEIPVWKLLRLWVAEGFVQQDENKKMSLEDSAESYLRDLVKRNLVMVGQKRANGQIKTCRIHDILREFCKQQAMKEHLFREIKRSDQASFLSADPSKFNYRRLFINSCVKDYISAIPSGMPVRSFLSFAKEEVALDSKHVSSIPKAFELLRVLDVRSIIFPSFPDELLKLVLLKYISISCDSNILPEKVSKLQSLQTVIIDTPSPILIIKADIWKMSQLRHLYTNASTCLPSPPIKTPQPLICPNLQTLYTISPESCRKNVLQRTPNIRKLGIRGELETSLFDSLFSLEFVENLKLMNEGKNSKVLALPQRINSLRKLTRLTLRNTMLDWKYMSTLGMLKNLVVLKLKNYAFRGESWWTEDGGFPRLEVLHIEKTNLVAWQASKDSFPLLSHLILRHCSELKEIPSAFGRITSLQNIELYYTNSLVASSAKKIQLLKLRVQKMPKTLETNGFQLTVQPPEHLGSGSTNQQYQPDRQISIGKELQATEISQETKEANGKELQRTKVSQEPNESSGKELQEVEGPQEPQKSIEKELPSSIEVTQESKASRGKEMQAIKVSEESNKSRENKLQGSEVPQKPKKSSIMQVVKKFFQKSNKKSKCNGQHLENKRKNPNVA